ncbi:TIR domain-containing protein [Bradyrhizobium sp. Pear77]|uniref:TIR domain-containing protein n=1 Tax=Bradyrhizobium altum TaxID=1571202 RepID=UPI001E350F3B|nr:TIR domain-containing protein [Bradyrhizobium altum]MCC8952715.1 TIR domain-containing protein [Bradyrhizobium altum]
MVEPRELRDFFISFNRADRESAKWIAYVIEEHGYKVYFQDWDFRGNFVEHMDRAHRTCQRTIAVLSDHYFGSAFTLGEWTARYAQDPASREDRIIPVRIGSLTDAGILGPIQCADLTNCDEDEAENRLMDRIMRALDPTYRSKPKDRPPFPPKTSPSSRSKSKTKLTQTSSSPLKAKKEPVTVESPADNNSRKFSESIRRRMAQLNRAIEELTSEQYRAINQLRLINRVRISGCAGSGKTLVATEKAIRLARGGVKTLLMCHNPTLAEHLRTLVLGTDVDVTSFQDWVARFVPYMDEAPLSWTHYQEPDTETLFRAFDEIVHQGITYAAIIVDEGQDFREEWWPLLDAALENHERSILYVFHDDHQALLPYRSRYSVDNPVIDLSRNCRNAAEIYKVLRVFRPQSPEPEIRLQNHGMVLAHGFRSGEERGATANVMGRILQAGYDTGMVALVGGPRDLQTSPFRNLTVPVRLTEAWQDSVRRYLLDAGSVYPARGETVAEQSERSLQRNLADLSDEPHPNAADVSLVCRLARQINIPIATGKYQHRMMTAAGHAGWSVESGKLRLRFSQREPKPKPYEIALFFAKDDWAEKLPKPRCFQFTQEPGALGKDKIRIMNVASFKGLEADGALLLFSDYNSSFVTDLYVALSRARRVVALLMNQDRVHLLPHPLRSIFA